MIIDHIGIIFFPENVVFRIIGRIAFPLFAYCIVVGVLYTQDVKKYLIRLALFGLISQPFYVLAFESEWFVSNIFLNLFVGVLVIHTINERHWIALAILLVFSGILDISYGLRGILLMIVFYAFRENRLKSIVFSVLVLALPTLNDILFNNSEISIQGFAIFALPFIYLNTGLKMKINKFVFYSFYPLHLFILYLARLYLL